MTRSAMPITMLNGLGCPDCGGSCSKTGAVVLSGVRRRRPLGSVTDYDVLIVGGVQYSAGQIVDKTLVAKKDTPIYPHANSTTPSSTIKSGQPIGQVYSYLKPSSLTNGRAALMFYTGPNYTGTPYYVFDEQNIDTNSLTTQGAQTVQQQVKEEADAKLKEDSPFEYYLKKYGLPALLIIGGISLVVGLGKEAVRDAFASRRAQPAALNGHRKKKRKK